MSTQLGFRLALLPISLPTVNKVEVVKCELKLRLAEHEKLMVKWMADVEAVWKDTQSIKTKEFHPWFNTAATLRSSLQTGTERVVDDDTESGAYEDDEPDDEENFSDSEWEDEDEVAESSGKGGDGTEI